jgi:diacylglycerol kinase family enzyme
MVVVSNIKRYALVLDMAPDASIDDGLLDVAFFRSAGVASLLKTLWFLRAGRHLDRHHVSYGHATRIKGSVSTPQPVHLDAEPFGVTPISIKVVPKSLPVLVPQ